MSVDSTVDPLAVLAASLGTQADAADMAGSAMAKARALAERTHGSFPPIVTGTRMARSSIADFAVSEPGGWSAWSELFTSGGDPEWLMWICLPSNANLNIASGIQIGLGAAGAEAPRFEIPSLTGFGTVDSSTFFDLAPIHIPPATRVAWRWFTSSSAGGGSAQTLAVGAQR